MLSEQPFRAHSGFEVAQVAPVHGFEVASEQPFQTHRGLEVAQVASVREIAVFLRRQVATKLGRPRDLPTPKRNY